MSPLPRVRPAVAGLLDLGRLFRLHIDGVEVTQAIQYRAAARHLTDPADRGADNAVPLIAGKPAWVRVYVRSGLFSGDVPGVTGFVEVRRRRFGLTYESLGALAPQPPGAVTAHVDPQYAVERGTLSSTLNFILPADQMCGHLLLHVRVRAPGRLGDTRDVLLEVTLRQTLHLRGIMVGYDGPSSLAPGAPNLTLAAPSVADLQTTSGWSLLTLPVQSAATYASGGTMTLNQPLTDPPTCAGCCSANWVALNGQVAAQATLDGNVPGVIYYGLLAAGIPMGPIIGCEAQGVSAGRAGDGITMAHEIGHHCGLPHAPCGFAVNPDLSYPAYEPYDPPGVPTASIGEYGLDISNGNVLSPTTFKDMMSYCAPRWISLRNYGRLVNNSVLDPVRVCVDLPWWRDIVLAEPQLVPDRWLPDPPPDPLRPRPVVDPQPLISLIGFLRSERELEVTSVMRLETRAALRGTATGLVAELRDARGAILSRGPVRELTAQACGCGEVVGHCGADAGRYPRLVQAFLADAGTGARLVVRRGEQELWSRRAPASPPRVTRFAAGIEGDRLVLTWGVECEPEEPEVWAQWSAGDTPWRALATGLSGGRADLHPSHLPPGAVALRLLAGDGFHTVVSEQVMVEVDQRPPAVSILSPGDGQTLIAGRPMRLLGAVTAAGDDGEDPRIVRWVLDGRPVAESLDAFVTAPAAGAHHLELQVSAPGPPAEATGGFVTVAEGESDADAQRAAAGA
jgi:hypothetical protein